MLRERVRSAGAQIDRMAHRWPRFELRQSSKGWLIWRGPLQGFQKEYRLGVCFKLDSDLPPYVMLIDPPLRPRVDGKYDGIPHLWYDKDDPEKSGLCLFDPEQKEWSSASLIADTTIPWAALWLLYYEFWHVDGVWRGTGRGTPGAIPTRPDAIH